MTEYPRAGWRLPLLLPILMLAAPAPAQVSAELPAPKALQAEGETPWIYRGSDVPQDKEWLFGEMDNGLRYAVRQNGVPPGQVSIRIRIDAGSLHELDSERGFAHLLEHMVFRESTYLRPGEAIPTWQRLGATFGSDTNAQTTPTQTVFQLDLPNSSPEKVAESFKLLSGMMRGPVFSKANLAADLPIVLAEKRERGGAEQRVEEVTRTTLFAGQRLAERVPIGTEQTLKAATPQSVKAFHDRWYRPENVVVVVVGDGDPMYFASLVEKWFGDWKGKGRRVPAPDFGDPVAPLGADPANPLGETAVAVEPGLPRSLTYAVLRPWRPVQDTIAYNQGLMLDAISQALINRRLEARARSGGSYLFAQVQQDDISRSTDATFINFAPLSEDWNGALADVRAVIADAVSSPPTQEEIDREVAEFDISLVNAVEQESVQAGSELANNIVQAVDIREATASSQTVLDVFRSSIPQMIPENILAHTKALFTGAVIRSVYITPSVGEADAGSLRTALALPVDADGSARLAAKSVSFADLPPIGAPGQVLDQRYIGVLDVEQIDFANGVKALIWPTDGEPGRVTVKVRFGAGWRSFDEKSAPYATLGEMALVGAGLGDLGQEELDRISTGRKMGFDFAIEEGVFSLTAQTRAADLDDQLYLFAAKLGMPRWDANPVLRAKAAAALTYESYAASPGGVLTRDLDYYLHGKEGRFATPDPAAIAATSPEGFRKVWEPLLRQGPVEVMVFGDFNRDQTVAALSRTFGALAPRDPVPADVLAKVPGPPPGTGDTTVLRHHGDPDQAAAVVAWPSGGGVANLSESRQLDILVQLFSNRLLEEMRERVGASYSPQVGSDWPVDVDAGGTVAALAQLRPEDVPVFFEVTQSIAADLAATPPGTDELERVTEPFRQGISRAATGYNFWLNNLQGASSDPQRIPLMRSLLNDYTQTTPEAMQALAQRYLARPGFKLAVIPEGQELVRHSPPKRGTVVGR